MELLNFTHTTEYKRYFFNVHMLITQEESGCYNGIMLEMVMICKTSLKQEHKNT